ncbi:alpha/beta fold hydrolase [Streptococcus sp. 20-1249]|uniref:alpha/beta fold hydrolase n=1 Tax=Streptococcus hepaticus TaxID=3349163 RepID=UPI003749CA4D
MKTIYFLGGLGENRHQAKDLEEYLGHPLIVIDLPGHEENFDDLVTTPQELTAWFAKQVDTDQPFSLIAHSMGANLAPYLAAQFPQLEKLVLLDGGYFEFDQFESLEGDLAGTAAFLEETTFTDMDTLIEQEKSTAPYWSIHLENALRDSFIWQENAYHFHLNKESVLALIRLQREFEHLLPQVTCPTLLIAQSDKDCPAIKKDMLAKVPAHIHINTSLDCGHSPHTEKPEQTAQAIREFFMTS